MMDHCSSVKNVERRRSKVEGQAGSSTDVKAETRTEADWSADKKGVEVFSSWQVGTLRASTKAGLFALTVGADADGSEIIGTFGVECLTDLSADLLPDKDFEVDAGDRGGRSMSRSMFS